jgi:hypothetical protein
LKKIQIAGNHIKELPSNTEIMEVKQLNLAQNELSAFPESMSAMTQMTNIICHQNKFTEIPNPIDKINPNRSLEVL